MDKAKGEKMTKPVRWASCDGAYLFQVPEEEGLIPTEDLVLLSGTLAAISIFLEKGDLKFIGEKLSVKRINLHPSFSPGEDESTLEEKRYVIHLSLKEGLCFQSIFKRKDITDEQSGFEKALLDSVVDTILTNLAKEGRRASDLMFLDKKTAINEIERMLLEIETKYQVLVASWTLSHGLDYVDKRFDFTDVCYNGKIRLAELFYDLGERAIESFDQLALGKEEKVVLYKIAKSMVGLSSIIYGEGNDTGGDQLNFAHSEIILEAMPSETLYRLDVRSYDVEGEQFYDVTIMR